MNSNTATQARDFDSLSGYIAGLWKAGGLSLVLVGLGAANLFLPSSQAYTDIKQLVITALLFLSGVTTWASVTVLALKRWQQELQLAGQQDATVIQAVAKIAERAGDSAEITARMKAFTESIPAVRR